MISTQPKAAQTSQSNPNIAIGADNGHGILKLVLGSGLHQMLVRCPSKFKEVRDEQTDYPTSKHGSVFYYRDGDRPDLIGQEWRTGDLAYSADPHGHIKLSDDAQNKITYALHSLLGSLGTLPHRPEWNLFLVASIHNSKLFKDDLLKAIEGTHCVNFGGRSGHQTRVKIKLSLVVPEGAGSYAHCRAQQLLDPTKHTIAVDFGTGTVIAQILAPGGAVECREVLSIGGCIDLLTAIAQDREIQLFEGGKAGDIELIRQGIEAQNFLYGNTGINFQTAYTREFVPWLKDRFSLALKVVRPWQKVAGSSLIWGGGAQLPGMATAVQKFGYKAVDNGGWANAIGLQRIAEGRLARQING